MDVMQSSRAQQSLDEGLDRTIEILSQHLTPTIPRDVIEYGSFINNANYINRLNQDNNHIIANSPLPNNLLINNSSTNNQISNDNFNTIQESPINPTIKKKEADEMKNIIDTLNIFNQSWPKPLSPLKPINPNDKSLLLKNEFQVDKDKFNTENKPSHNQNNIEKTEISKKEEYNIPIKVDTKSNISNENELFEEVSSSLSSIPSYSLTSNSDSASSKGSRNKNINSEAEKESRLKSVKSESDDIDNTLSKKKLQINKTSLENTKNRKRSKANSDEEVYSEDENYKRKLKEKATRKTKVISVKQELTPVKNEENTNEPINKSDAKSISMASYRKRYSHENNENNKELNDYSETTGIKRRKKSDKSTDYPLESTSKEKKIKSERSNNNSDSEYSTISKEPYKSKIKEKDISNSNNMKTIKSQKIENDNSINKKNTKKSDQYSDSEEESKDNKRKISINAHIKRQNSKKNKLFSDSESDQEMISNSKKSNTKLISKKMTSLPNDNDELSSSKKNMLTGNKKTNIHNDEDEPVTPISKTSKNIKKANIYSDEDEEDEQLNKKVNSKYKTRKSSNYSDEEYEDSNYETRNSRRKSKRINKKN